MKLHRRAAMGAIGVAGAAAAAANSAGAQGPALPDPGLPGPAPADPTGVGPYRRVCGRMTGARALAAALACEGVPCVFGVPGAQNNEFWDAMKTLGVPYLLVASESAASVMADASARMTGRVGTFAVVPGPGLTNALTGIGEAWLDGVPIVGIVTDVDREPGAPVGQVHGLNNAAIVRPVTKAVIEVQHQGQIPGAVHQAFAIARSGEPGPTAVIVPYPLFALAWDYDCPVPVGLPRPFDEAAYRRALALLSDRSRRVGIYAGMGCVDATGPLAAVAELLQAPVATSVSGKGVLPDGHRLAVGWGYGAQGTRAAERRFQDVDLVLAVGVRYSEVSTANYAIPEHDALIHVDVNPRNLGRNVPATVKVNADAGLFFDRLLADAACVRREPEPKLWAKIERDRQVDRAGYERPQVRGAVDPMYFLAELRRALHPDAAIFVDVTASTHWAAESMDVCGPRRYFSPANNQSMGWAVAAAIGGQRTRPDRQVVAVTGDGCFLMGGLEATTAVRSALPVKFFVLDDGTYHYMQMLQEPAFGRTTATEIARVDYGHLARALGLGFVCVDRNDTVCAAIRQALSMPGPVLTRVVISYEGRELRWLSALKGSYLDKLSNGQKLRMATRIAARTADPRPDSD